MTSANADPFAKFKAAQREAWAPFAPVEVTSPAMSLQHFRNAQDKTIGPLTKLVESLQNDAGKSSASSAPLSRRLRPNPTTTTPSTCNS